VDSVDTSTSKRLLTLFGRKWIGTLGSKDSASHYVKTTGSLGLGALHPERPSGALFTL